MGASDFILYNVPAMLARQVQRRDPSDPDQWIRDEAWYEQVRRNYYALFSFLNANGLVTQPIACSAERLDSVVLRFSDLTPLGQAFVRSRAVDKWLTAAEKSQGAPDTKPLSKSLAKLVAAT
jgi:hypothetical protein